LKTLCEYNPIVIFIYFLSVITIAMFFMNPILILISLISSCLFFALICKEAAMSSHLYFLLMFFIIAIVNPLFNHNGVTVLFMMNDNPITLEAVFYGIVSSAMIMAVIYWFRSFSKIMTSEKLLYLLGSFSPKARLILSMTLRYIPLFKAQSDKINDAQKVTGLYKDDNFIDSIRGKVRIFSIMVTWALENGITTSDSMVARGYGIGKRSHFSTYRFRRNDLVLTVFILFLFSVSLIGTATGTLDFEFYPMISQAEISPLGILSLTSYFILSVLPSVIEVKEALKWRSLRSKI